MLVTKGNEIYFSVNNKSPVIKASFALDASDACAILNNISYDESLTPVEREKFSVLFYEELKEHISANIPDHREADLLILAPMEVIKFLHSAKPKVIPGSYEALMIRPPNLPLADAISLNNLAKKLGAKKVEIVENKKILAENAKALCQLMLDGAHWARKRKYTAEFICKLIDASTTSTALKLEYDDGRVEWPCFVRNIASTQNGLFYVSDMCTHPNYQNKGIGGVVLQANLKNIAAESTGLLTVSPEYPGNVAGKKLYEKFGFKFHSEYKRTEESAKMQLHFEFIPSRALVNKLNNSVNNSVTNTVGQFLLAPPKEGVQSVANMSENLPGKIQPSEQSFSFNK